MAKRPGTQANTLKQLKKADTRQANNITTTLSEQSDDTLRHKDIPIINLFDEIGRLSYSSRCEQSQPTSLPEPNAKRQYARLQARPLRSSTKVDFTTITRLELVRVYNTSAAYTYTDASAPAFYIPPDKVQAILSDIPSPNITYGTISDRCRAIQFNPLGYILAEKEYYVNHIHRMNNIIMEMGLLLLEDFVLGPLEYQKIAHEFIVSELLRRCHEELQAIVPVELLCEQDFSWFPRLRPQEIQRCVMIRTLAYVDGHYRHFEEQDELAFHSCYWLDAMRWQYDIFESWLDRMLQTKNEKRRVLREKREGPDEFGIRWVEVTNGQSRPVDDFIRNFDVLF